MTDPSVVNRSDGLLLPGLDGTNPLGFLAALGVLRMLDLQNQANAARVKWHPSGGTWSPVIFGGGCNIEELLEHIDAGFKAGDPASWKIDKKLPFEADRLRAEAIDAVSNSSRVCRDRVDTLASFGVECVRDDKGIFKDTSLRMVRAGDSAGNGLLAYGKRILDETKEDDLRSALTDSWKYEDQDCALRWDPAEYRGYAMQWANPSSEKTVSVRGGNRLALAAMPLLATIPCRATVGTIAFGKPNQRNECFTWPLWSVPCCLGVVKSLLTLPSLQDEQPSQRDLKSRGVEATYRCERIMTSTYYRNFTPAQRIA